ncbi:hypothetical protein L873DRAFT_1845693 [Choiromyces venosus 120613-1]|uniref:Uncharacterized protein n=1 Tax=Choiromyces venosus 120613-1 TaxID=1336337 RepID=A0A3N4JC74_9PEZI|nr:hypothetical protein L873DRAFT_1845693 [Choiromyces venosus 120613-1]
MSGNSQKTLKNARMPKHITEIGMTTAQYYELKVYLKSIILPGTPPFGSLQNSDSKRAHRQWLNNALREIGPRFFPGGVEGLVWPKDYDEIYNVVHQAVRVMSIGMRKQYEKEQGDAQKNGDNDVEMEIVQDGELGGAATSGEADFGEGVKALDEDETYAEWEKEEEMMRAMIEEMEKDIPVEDMMEGMDAEPLELEYMLELMKPEMFVNFPDFIDEHFDWDAIVDVNKPEPVARLLLLLS